MRISCFENRDRLHLRRNRFRGSKISPARSNSNTLTVATTKQHIFCCHFFIICTLPTVLRHGKKDIPECFRRSCHSHEAVTVLMTGSSAADSCNMSFSYSLYFFSSAENHWHSLCNHSLYDVTSPSIQLFTQLQQHTTVLHLLCLRNTLTSVTIVTTITQSKVNDHYGKLELGWRMTPRKKLSSLQTHLPELSLCCTSFLVSYCRRALQRHAARPVPASSERQNSLYTAASFIFNVFIEPPVLTDRSLGTHPNPCPANL